jgi:hypothetical protein
MRTTFDGGTSFANSVACLGFDPPLPARKTDAYLSLKVYNEWRVRTVPPFVSCDQAEVLGLCFGTLSNAATHTTLNLVRGTDTLVPFFQVNCHCRCGVG